MSAAGSLVGRKRERPAHSPGPKGAAGPKSAGKALERLAAAHTACTRLISSYPYPDSLSEVALALQHLLGAKMVVLHDHTGALGAMGVAPAATETRGWLAALRHQHLEGREPSVVTFELEASDAALALSGVRRFVVVPLSTGRGHGALWIGFGDQGPSSPEEVTCVSILGEHLSLALREAPTKPTASTANGVDLPNGKHASPPVTHPAPLTPSELISLAAHELRTPLTPITMLLQSLERKARSGTADVETILRARKQVTRLTKMISDLLDLSRLREDRLILTPVHLDLGRFAREAVETFREADPRHQVQIEDEMQVIEVEADESRLHYTLSSLLDHVAHATPAGGIIEVTLQRREALGVITVRADRPVFGGDVLKATEIVDPPHPRPEPIALSLLLAQSITARLGGTLSLTPSRPHETRVEATFPLCATDR